MKDEKYIIIRANSLSAPIINKEKEILNSIKSKIFMIEDFCELEDFKELFQYEKLSKLLGILDSVNPKVQAAKRKKGEEVIEL